MVVSGPVTVSDAEHRARYVAGQRFEELVARELRLAEIEVELVNSEVVEDRDRIRAGELADVPDLLVGGRDLLEVKSRDLAFTSPADYPYATAFVGRRARWDRRTAKVAAVVLVSMRTEAMVVVPLSTRPLWVVEKAYDSVTRREETSYAAPREALRPWEALVEWLRDRRLSRRLVCNECSRPVVVFEAPANWIDPARYVCGRCIEDRARPRQSTLPLDARISNETPKYDPAQARIPY
jgi:hypothetical protein